MKKIAIITLLLVTITSFLIIPAETTCNTNQIAAINASTNQETISLPIVMYHSVLKSRRSKYTIHPDDFERDVIAYKEMGYTPVTLREVADWVNGKGTLPEKPMVITFDDGHYNNLHYALPILQKHNAKAVINVITSFSRVHSENANEANKPAYSYLTWENIRKLHDSGLVEIGNHTHAMHKIKPRFGIAQVSNETVDEYKNAIRKDLENANKYLTENAGVPRPTTFAYPFGKYSKAGLEVLKELGFQAMLTCNEGISTVTKGNPESLIELKRYNRSGNASREKFIKKVFG